MHLTFVNKANMDLIQGPLLPMEDASTFFRNLTLVHPIGSRPAGLKFNCFILYVRKAPKETREFCI